MDIFRVKFTHRPHYGGFLACSAHANEHRGSAIIEVEAVDPASLHPLPQHVLAAGHGHCQTCNRTGARPVDQHAVAE